MKILILTQPLALNYGGLLQTYALQTVLKQMGHQVWTEDRRVSTYDYLKNRLRYFARNIVFSKNKKYIPTNKDFEYLQKEIKPFIDKHICTTFPIKSSSKKRLISKYLFNAYIVGSDQVWRPRYSPNIYNYFLDFTGGLDVKRIAYAASFGTDNWEFSEEETDKCKNLIQQFNAVSVREHSGIELCKKYLNIPSFQTLDPTMLLTKDDYKKLLSDETIQQNVVFTHFLDESEEKKNIAKKVGKLLNCETFSILPTKKFHDYGRKYINDCKFPSVEDFIKSISSAKYIVTDSFHVVVFSLLFNKPFVVVGNPHRGLARINSLLKPFELQYRLIENEAQVEKDLLERSLNFSEIERKIEIEREKSFNFLSKVLS